MKKIRIWFEDFWHPSTHQDISCNPLYAILSRYYDLELTKKKPDFLLYSCFGNNYLNFDCIRIFYTGENVRPNFKECDYAFSFDYPVTDRNYRLPLYRLYSAYDSLLKPRNPEIIVTQQRKFCCFLATNSKCKERNEFFQLLSSYKKVDAGGKLFFNIEQTVPHGTEIEWMKNYKFCIAFENSSQPGYTTEKLLNALVANTIPIYWGNPMVEHDFNTNAFINCHEFIDFYEVIEEIKRVDHDFRKYKNILSEPFLHRNKENGFCKEEEIINKFEEIFSTTKAYIPKGTKKLQRLENQINTKSTAILKYLNK